MLIYRCLYHSSQPHLYSFTKCFSQISYLHQSINQSIADLELCCSVCLSLLPLRWVGSSYDHRFLLVTSEQGQVVK